MHLATGQPELFADLYEARIRRLRPYKILERRSSPKKDTLAFIERPAKRNTKRRCCTALQKKYHVRNWAEYNEGLRRRGDLTVWFDEEAIANWMADKTGKPGGQRVYSDMAIETGLVVRMVYKLA